MPSNGNTRRPRPSFNDEDKSFLYERQKGKCKGCQRKFPMGELTVDHKKAFSKGGSDKPSNLQLLCKKCNSIKGTKTQAQFLKRLVELGIIKSPDKPAATTSKPKPQSKGKAKPKPKRKETTWWPGMPKRGDKSKDPVDAYLDGIDDLFRGL